MIESISLAINVKGSKIFYLMVMKVKGKQLVKPKMISKRISYGFNQCNIFFNFMTMRILGNIKKKVMTILIDLGSTYNFFV